MDIFEHTAKILEKAAAYIDIVETDRNAVVNTERRKVATAIKDRYEEITGEAAGEDLADKLAGADIDLLEALGHLTDNSIEKTAEMGGAAEVTDSSAPMTKKEILEAADERFLNWCLSE